jgi:hypothetical protein
MVEADGKRQGKAIASEKLILFGNNHQVVGTSADQIVAGQL